MENPAGSRSRRRPRPALLLPALVFASITGGPWSLSWAAVCETTATSSFRVENVSSATELKAAMKRSDGGRLEVVWAGAVALDAPIVVGSGTCLMISGEDQQAEAQGGHGTRIFEVSAGGELNLTQLRLSRGAAPNGGAIRALGARLTLDRCTFYENVATGGSGGAVWVEDGEVLISGGGFLNNSAAWAGGAVFTNNTEVTVRDAARFEQNRAALGGALYSKGLSCSLSNATFSLNNATFSLNNASVEAVVGDNDDSLFSRGGAAAFVSAEVTVKDSEFADNFAGVMGGALFGGKDSLFTVYGCVFWNNTATQSGGAMSASSATVGGGAELMHNFAHDNDGGAIFGWDDTGRIELLDIICNDNTAVRKGGCFYSSGIGIVNNGSVMHGNVAYLGGCIYAASFSDVTVQGGDFTCLATRNGGFLFTSDGGRVRITGGLVSNNVAERKGGAATQGIVLGAAPRRGSHIQAHGTSTSTNTWIDAWAMSGGQVYCSGESDTASDQAFGGSKVSIEGGVFDGNKALEVGGAVMIWGPTTVITITGGIFKNNHATFSGGFIFLELESSLYCDGATIQDNYAGGQGGGIYAQLATCVNSSCDMIGNESPQGAAAYLTHVGSATLENLEIAGHSTSGGGALFITESSVVARAVTFESGVGMEEESANRAIEVDGSSALLGQECVFNGWIGDAVIYNSSPEPGSAVLNSCDFRGSSASMAVVSPYSNAEIRNAIVGDNTVENAENRDPLELVDRALDCAHPKACGRNEECVNSALGVLCECLPGSSGECLDDGGAVSLTLKTPAEKVTYSPSPVAFELQVSAAEDGTTCVIWELTFKAEDLVLTAEPSSGILPPGGNATVAVTGTARNENVGGLITSTFILSSVGEGGGGNGALSGGSQNSDSDNDETFDGRRGRVKLDVDSNFFLCAAYQYASLDTMEDGGDVTIECKQCTTLDGFEGVDCDVPGATLASLPVREGYWRESNGSGVIHSCLNSDACVGATRVSSSDDYCADGHEGPYCAVCSSGYGQGMGRACHSCSNTTMKSRLLIAAGAILSIVGLLFLVFVVVFLIGGLDAVGRVRRSMVTSLPSFSSKAWQLSRFTSSSGDGGGGGRDTRPVSTERSTRLRWRNARQDRAPSAGSAFSLVMSHFRSAKSPSVRVLPSDLTYAVGTGVAGGGRLLGLSRYDSTAFENERSARRWAKRSPTSVGSNADSADSESVDDDSDGGGDERSCCDVIGAKTKSWTSRLPLDKFKILVVVWQILTVFPSVTGVNYPSSYSRFLSIIDVVNLDLGRIFSASCLLPSITFYERLLATTLVPIALSLVLVCTHKMAKRRARIGSRGVVGRRAAWSRHIAAGLMMTFLIFTSTSTTVFKTFACDDDVVTGESYLREDYRISCQSSTHTFFMFYAGFMILLYPVGIPLLYFFILRKNRHLLNPSITESAKVTQADNAQQIATTPAAAREIEERIRMRKQHPDLVPSMFLWKDFGPDLYYYEVIECARRMLLTGVLIFIAPHTAAQSAMACIFAFAILLGFELLRPHVDTTDTWLYRLGCVVIFLSNFLALLIKVDASRDRNCDILGGLLVAINVVLVLIVIWKSWFAMQEGESKEESMFVTMMKTVSASERLSEHPVEPQRTRDRSAANSSVLVLL